MCVCVEGAEIGKQTGRGVDAPEGEDKQKEKTEKTTKDGRIHTTHSLAWS